MLTDFVPVLWWLTRKVAEFHDYLDRWILLLDPGEDNK